MNRRPPLGGIGAARPAFAPVPSRASIQSRAADQAQAARAPPGDSRRPVSQPEGLDARLAGDSLGAVVALHDLCLRLDEPGRAGRKK